MIKKGRSEKVEMRNDGKIEKIGRWVVMLFGKRYDNKKNVREEIKD